MRKLHVVPEICFPIIGKHKTGAELGNEIRLRRTKSCPCGAGRYPCGTKSALRVDLCNDNQCAQGNEVKERGGIPGGEADAAVGDGGAEAGGIGCAVNVDEAGEGVGVVRFEPVQREDAGEDGILSPAGGGVEPHGHTRSENGVQRGVFPVFGADDEAAQGGAHSSLVRTFFS